MDFNTNQVVQLKIEFEGDLRRASISRTDSLAKVKTMVASLIGVPSCEIKYRDEENDLISIGTDQELQEFLLFVDQYKQTTGKMPRVIAQQTGTASAQTEPSAQQQPEPEVPFLGLATALANPQIVAKMQSYFSSPEITRAVTTVASAYVTSRGDMLTASMVGFHELPALGALVARFFHEFPELKDLQHLVMPLILKATTSSHQSQPVVQQQQQSHGNHQVQRHWGVFCDGCSSDETLKQTSIAAGHMTRHGFIRGTRHKSMAVRDFDLCDSCKSSGRFTEQTYGPFSVVPGPLESSARGCRGGGGGGRQCWFGGGRGGGEGNRNWRKHPDFHEPPTVQQNQPSVRPQPAVPAPEKPASVASDQSSSTQAATEAFSLRDLFKSTESFLQQSVAGTEYAELVRVLAESLKGEGDKESSSSTVYAQPAPEQQHEKKKEDTMPVASPVVQQEPSAPPAAETMNDYNSDPFIKWASQMSQLQALGFEDLEAYVPILEEEKGDLERVINRLV